MTDLPVVPFEAPSALALLGRVEDLAWSPSGRRLALASFYRAVIVVFDVEIDEPAVAGVIEVRLRHHVTFGADGFAAPHGIAFMNEDTMAVANRSGDALVVQVPTAPGAEDRVVVVEPVVNLSRVPGRLPLPIREPGSVTVRRVGDLYDVLVCSNWYSTVNRFVLDLDLRVLASDPLVQEGLRLCDGVAFSGDGALIAISSHDTKSVDVHRNDPALDVTSPAVGRLLGTEYPHGLSFGVDPDTIIVADAGAPVMAVYRTTTGWVGEHRPVKVVRAMDDATFERGRYNPREGGPKGLALHPSGRLVALACEHQPLRFLDLCGVLPTGAANATAARPGDVEALGRWAMARLTSVQRQLAEERAMHEARNRAVERYMRAIKFRARVLPERSDEATAVASVP